MSSLITTHTVLFFFSTLFILLKNSSSYVTYNVVNLGADPNGITDSTSAFENAWSRACNSSKPAAILVPNGTFLLGLIKFNGPCLNNAIGFRVTGTLIAPSDYEVLRNETSWIQIFQVDGLSIDGGVVDGKGKALWYCKSSSTQCPIGTTNIGFYHSKNINISSFTSLDSQMFHMVIYGCENVMLDGVTIVAPENSPNTDGIHIQGSSFVQILRTNISTGDDCVSIGPGSNNLWMENISCGPGHGISIGGLGMETKEDGVHTVTVKTATFSGTQNGVRIKTLGTNCESIVKDITFEHATLKNVQNPIIIDQNYCAGGQGCTGKPSQIKISNVTYNDIHGSSATQVAVKFDCSPMKPCDQLTLEDINLTYNGNTAESSCANAYGQASGAVNPPPCLK